MRDAESNPDIGEQDTLAAFYVIGKKPHEVISGWIALEDELDEFRKVIFEEMEFTLQIQVEKQNEYSFYYVDLKKKNSLSMIDNQALFEELKKTNNLRIMLLHNSIPIRQVETHPRFCDWLEETDET
ncbi:MAG: hypothetical protein JW779_05495 [Candidatus Thorarchaeota archaeon]|nr:hypothetical protein [Candidatus Thorarchaeota archaeon]